MFAPKPAFVVFPWQRSFIDDLKTYLDEQTGQKPWQALLIVPHTRPWRYLIQSYGQNHRPTLLPKVMTIEEVTTRFLLENNCPTFPQASILDCTFILHQCVQELVGQDPYLADQFAALNPLQFWPWGSRLAGILDEFYRQGLRPQDIDYAEDLVADPAKALLGALGKISDLYQQKLKENRLSTQGLDLLTASQHLERIPPIMEARSDRLVLISGFALLDGAEEKLLATLWQNGAHVCLHTDPNLVVNPNLLHRACQIHADWQASWHAQAELAFDSLSQDTFTSPKYKFFQGYDGHSQLLGLQNDLNQTQNRLNSTAIILQAPSLLLPLLHHLPQKRVNVTMGYPLRRTLLGQLAEILLKLKERSTGQTAYWRDLLHFLRHPYIKNLDLPKIVPQEKPGYHPNQEERVAVLAIELLEENILAGQRYQNLAEIINNTLNSEPSALEKLGSAYDLMIVKLGSATTLRQLAEVWEEILNFLSVNWKTDWLETPLDAEAFARMREEVLTTLKTSLAADLEVPFLLAKNVFLNLIDSTRVPFEDEPISGIQILGLLETRLLHFEQLYFLDSSDDYLPGKGSQDMLMPELLRKQIGLPGLEEKNARHAYNLFRLCANAKEVNFYWQEGATKSAVEDVKRTRSRYVEQLIWAEEQKLGHILQAGQDPLRIASQNLTTTKRKPIAIKRSEGLEEALNRYLLNGISPTTLDTYLHCQLRFVYEQLLKIHPTPVVAEGDAPYLTGQWLHRIMYNLFHDKENIELDNTSITRSELLQNLHDQKTNKIIEPLPALSYFFANIAGEILLEKYLRGMEPTIVLALEQKISAAYGASQQVNLTGKIDRVDKRDDNLIILDYKSGKLTNPKRNFWQNKDLLDNISLAHEQNCQDDQELNDLFFKLSEELPSIQLPFYIVLANNAKNYENDNNVFTKNIYDAALINLAKDGKEQYFFGKAEFTLEERTKICDDIVWLTISSLLNTQEFRSTDDYDHCKFCPYIDLCML
ncbi:MAG: PD-(D/E)XK nuclease family protein [Desulfovibrionaceae bacterium]|nr:PD-(D/E)XK nuclease family protein [Desulfovibrionaceae bacterium]